MRCPNPICERNMVGLVTVKVAGVRIPRIADVNQSYWKFNWKEHELEGVGYICLNCGNARIVKPFVVDEATGLATPE